MYDFWPEDAIVLLRATPKLMGRGDSEVGPAGPIGGNNARSLGKQDCGGVQNFVAASPRSLNVIFGRQMVHKIMQPFQQFAQRLADFWCVFGLLYHRFGR
jgi:hypothetical protein